MKRPCLFAAVTFVALAPLASGQVVPRPQSPLLFVRFHGAPGTRITFWRDPAGPRSFEVPATVGLRPGYVYRPRIDNIPGRPGVALYPTLEVRGTLAFPTLAKAGEHPAPLVLSETDLDRVEAGSFVTKVVYLENPERAVPVSTRPDQPLETTLPAGGRDLVDAARDHGRPMVVVRLGSRAPDEQELRACAVPGTVLYPGETSLLPPRLPPPLAWACVPMFYDPVLGPRPPLEECLHDGGDIGRPAGIGPDGRAGGVDPSDTVAEYTDDRGRRRLAKSNRVCLCVPRFGVLRNEQPLSGYQMSRGPDDARKEYGAARSELQVPSREALNREALQALRMRLRPSTNVNEQVVGGLLLVRVLDAYHVYDGPGELIGTKRAVELTEVQRARMLRQMKFALAVGRTEGTAAFEQTRTTAVVGRLEGAQAFQVTFDTREVSCLCGEPPQIMVDKPMVLCKWADRDSAQIGDVVTFTIKYMNNGGRPIGDVAVTDSLTPRLEYVPGSAKTDRPAVFTMQGNEAGSVTLRWEINGKLPPGERGIVSFQARLR